MSTTPDDLAQRLGIALQPFVDTDLVTLFNSAGGAEAVREALGEIASPDLVTLMIGGDRDHPFTGTFHGIEGFIEAWRDYTATFASLRNELTDFAEVRPGVVYAETHQTGETATARVEIDYLAAAIFRFADGRLEQAEFHLDRESAKRAAGLLGE